MKRGLIALLAVAATVLVPTATAGTVRSLAGESFTAGSTQILSCGIDDWGGSVRFATTGTATGPYPGTFTETGTITVGAADPFGRQTVTAVAVDFTVTTAGYTIAGSHVFSGYTGGNRPTASCLDSWTGMRAAASVFDNTLRWSATIATSAGLSCTAAGPALLSFQQGQPVIADSFSETFYNDYPATEPSCVGADTTPPWFTQLPGDLTVDATSADGAVVEYEVAAADDTDAAPAVSCAPASGSTFAIGQATVTCLATDAAGNVSAPATFVVTVRGAVEQVEGLTTGVAGLDAKQKAILADIQAGRIDAACGVLGAYANQVAALAGKKLTADQAAALLATVSRVKTLLGC